MGVWGVAVGDECEEFAFWFQNVDFSFTSLLQMKVMLEIGLTVVECVFFFLFLDK